MIYDDPGVFIEDSNWGPGDVERGFAGNDHFRMVGTEADGNDPWVEVAIANEPPAPEPWQRITCVGLRCSTGQVHVMSVIDDKPALSVNVESIQYLWRAATWVSINSVWAKPVSSPTRNWRNAKILNGTKIIIVPGKPPQQGRLKDE